ncbi:MAG: 30S ribosomal protein S13 [Candidatus Sungbacteria bacterium RIFCSPHIGHO2_02_FULL_49_12]|uniref:Small ribosomal subunit protein uS13 n=1 Tax=Candidatus Sungbacteria bacterium RIFCSPHIGHO2_02_FULL_49_12 TaxID=1802271 RepID=A0A1G2KN85_9BACT|nr:MAG: 30S ribosomal protein S13 [Candidatus Sungbacteria bacterium RIFCSPHIGHO2_02_FULL_49_12]
MRIAGIPIPDKKRIVVALTYVFGVGLTASQKILAGAKVDPNKRSETLTQDEINRIREILEKNYRIEGDLRREIMMNVKRLKDIGTFRGLRHMRGLPVRGQRTKTNSRTRRGNVRKTMGSGRKTAASPT